MKKIIISVITFVMALFICINLNVYAGEYYEEFEYPDGYNKISEKDSFYATEIRGLPEEKVDEEVLRYIIKYNRDGGFQGSIKRTREIDNSDDYLESRIVLDDDEMEYSLYFNNDLYIEFYYKLGNDFYYYLNNPILLSNPTDPNYKNNYRRKINKPNDDKKPNIFSGSLKIDIESFIMFFDYELKEEKTIDDKLNNIPTFDEIFNNTELMLSSGEILKNGFIISSNYEKRIVGNYYMIIGYLIDDKYYAISYNIIINDPILQTPDIYVSKNKKLTDNDIRNQIKSTGLKNYNYDADEYFEYYDKPGRYNVFVSYSIDDNIFNFKFRIIVIELGDYEIEIKNKDIFKHEYYNEFDIEDLKERLIYNHIISDTVEIDLSKYEINKNVAGLYPIFIKGYDDLGNLYIQSYMINVLDNVKPNVSLPDDLIYSYSYNDIIDFDYYKYNFIVNDISDYEITYDIPKSLQEGLKIGEYDIIYKIIDIYSNEEQYTIKIKIVDDVAPKIICSNINVDIKEKLDINDLKRNVYAYDEIDGDISLDNITIDDVDSYLNNYDKKGTYKINVMVHDSNNNYSHATYNVIVNNKDTTNKEIYISSKYKYTKEELMKYLINQQIIENENDYKLESQYFDNDKLEKTYDLEIIDENDNKEIYKLILNDLEINYKDNEENEKKDNSIIIVISAISGVLIIIIGILIFIIYKKRH